LDRLFVFAKENGAREDGNARGPLSGFFDDLHAPDQTLERVLTLCTEAACAISATELAVDGQS
jgi:hypothetical protein